MKALLLLVLVGVGVFGAKAMLERPTPPPAAVDARVEAGPAPTAAAGEMEVVFDEVTLTERLNTAVAVLPLGDTPLGPASARDLAVQLRNGEVRVTGQAQAGVASLPVSVAGAIRVESEQPVVGVREATVGSVPLPNAVRQQLERALQGLVDQLLAENRVRVRSVTVADGKLTLIGNRAAVS